MAEGFFYARAKRIPIRRRSTWPNDQAEFARIVEPFGKELEFSGNDIVWWPLGRERQIIVDPKRNLGQPSAARSGVPARVLARSVKTNRSIRTVSHWFEVSEAEVRDAVEFETRLAA